MALHLMRITALHLQLTVIDDHIHFVRMSVLQLLSLRTLALNFFDAKTRQNSLSVFCPVNFLQAGGSGISTSR